MARETRTAQSAPGHIGRAAGAVAHYLDAGPTVPLHVGAAAVRAWPLSAAQGSLVGGFLVEVTSTQKLR